MLLAYSRGLHHVQAPGERFPRLFRTVSMRFECVDIASYRDGLLANRLRGAEGRILAKTGSLRHVNALAGYAQARDGERLAFAILLNHHTLPAREATEAIDAVAALLVD